MALKLFKISTQNSLKTELTHRPKTWTPTAKLKFGLQLPN